MRRTGGSIDSVGKDLEVGVLCLQSWTGASLHTVEKERIAWDQIKKTDSNQIM